MTAIANLVEIRQYIEQDKREAARRLAKRILQSVDRLAKHPHLGARVASPKHANSSSPVHRTSFRIKCTEAGLPFLPCCTPRRIEQRNDHVRGFAHPARLTLRARFLGCSIPESGSRDGLRVKLRCFAGRL